ncbi:MAG: threonine synthase, partial [Oscillospiraceae bacterium]|nr:threonine synthase [Oscillospiraceae bacterium]
MLYHSTRDMNLTANSAEAVLEGLAPDGGLYMPAALPAFDWQKCIKGSAMDMSADILGALLPDIPNIPDLVKAAYTDK